MFQTHRRRPSYAPTKALYYVKEHGRNPGAQFENLVRDGQIGETHIVGDVELF